MDADTLLALDALAQRMMIKTLMISHLDAELTLFASPTVENGKLVEYYYCSLVYSNLIKERQKKKRYGEVVMLMTVKTFRKWVN